MSPAEKGLSSDAKGLFVSVSGVVAKGLFETGSENGNP